MNHRDNKKKRLGQLTELVSQYLDDNVTKPSLETIGKDFFAQDHLASLLMLVRSVIDSAHREGAPIDIDYLWNLPKEEIEKRIDVLGQFIASQESDSQNSNNDTSAQARKYLMDDTSKKYLLSYVHREINWITISILSASYISSMILMRSVFELIIGMATRHTGSMGDRIAQISFLQDGEKKRVLALWNLLCAWGHPYGKWLKNVCPIYTAHKPLYHAKLCELCLKELEKVVDLFVAVVIAKYDIDISIVSDKINELSVDISGFELLRIRLSA